MRAAWPISAPWDGFEAAPEPFLHNFLRQDELTPELDVTS